MNRKFSELTPSEQVQFKGLVDFMKETWNEDIGVKLSVVKRFNLAIDDPVVMDFLTDVYVPTPRVDMPYDEPIPTPTASFAPNPVPVQAVAQPLVPASPQQPAKTKSKREMTYANSEDLIIIQNRLLHAISHLTLNERRLILFLSPIVRKQIEKDPNNRVFHVYVQDFIDEYGIKSKKYYGELEKIADSIVEKAFFFWYKTKNGKAKKGVSWVSECDYIENEGMIKVRLDNTVIEMLTVFDANTGNLWSQYQKEWVINLGTYGIIMLELVLSSLDNTFEKDKKGVYSIEHLREKFDCIDLYPRFSNFKRYVIDKSIQEVHKHTPIKISYEVNRVGRQVESLKFSYINTRKMIENTQNTDDKPKEKNPFANFKMSQKQLSLFATKIKKATGQDIDEIINELCNVHLQSKHIDFLKVLDFVPSDWYTESEMKDHLTAEQIAQEKLKAKQKAKEQTELEQAQLRQDYEVLLANAEEFVLANQKRLGFGIEKMYFENGDYQAIVKAWKQYLLNKRDRKGFALLDEILSR